MPDYDFEQVYSNTPRTKLLVAALKGLVMLQDTYSQDIKNFSRGELNLKSNEVLKSRRQDVLHVEDLASMSGVAFNDLHWYDASIRYLREAIEVFISTTRKAYHSDYFENFLHESLASMKKWYASYHNEMLNRIDNPIELNYKTFPVKINEGNGTLVLHILFGVKYSNFSSLDIDYYFHIATTKSLLLLVLTVFMKSF